MKGNRSHSIPLTPALAQILKYLLKAELLFPIEEGTSHNN
jgi:hypothetical protein